MRCLIKAGKRRPWHRPRKDETVFEGMLDGRGATLATAILGVSVALMVLVVVFWLMKARGGRGDRAKGGRGRMPRLGVLDVVAVDTRRRLVLIRRDDVEHLVMIGGPNDFVIETRIADDRAPVLGAASREEGLAATERRPVKSGRDATEPDRSSAPPKAVPREPTPASTPFAPATPAVLTSSAPQSAPPAQFPPERFVPSPRPPASPAPITGAGGITAGNPFEEADFSAVLDAQMKKDGAEAGPPPASNPPQAPKPTADARRAAPDVAPAVESPASRRTDERTLQEEMAKLLADMATNKR